MSACESMSESMRVFYDREEVEDDGALGKLYREIMPYRLLTHLGAPWAVG